ARSPGRPTGPLRSGSDGRGPCVWLLPERIPGRRLPGRSPGRPGPSAFWQRLAWPLRLAAARAGSGGGWDAGPTIAPAYAEAMFAERAARARARLSDLGADV